MIGFKCLELSPSWRQVIVQMTATLLALVGENSTKAVQVRHEGLDGQVWIKWWSKVEHSSVDALRDFSKHLVSRIAPNVQLAIKSFGFFIKTLNHHPFNHEAFENEHRCEYSTQWDLFSNEFSNAWGGWKWCALTSTKALSWVLLGLEIWSLMSAYIRFTLLTRFSKALMKISSY